MNNSLNLEHDDTFSIEPVVPTESLREREAKLVRMVEAVVALSQTREWSTLKKELFDEIASSIENRIKSETAKSVININELYRLQGELAWARKYGNLMLLAKDYQNELSAIRKLLNPPGGAG